MQHVILVSELQCYLAAPIHHSCSRMCNIAGSFRPSVSLAVQDVAA